MGSECAILGTEIGGDREKRKSWFVIMYCNGFLYDIMRSIYTCGIPTLPGERGIFTAKITRKIAHINRRLDRGGVRRRAFRPPC